MHKASFSGRNRGKKSTTSNRTNGRSTFMGVPVFDVIEATPTENWHEVHKAEDIVEQPEWALYLYLNSIPKQKAIGTPVAEDF